LLRVDLAEVTDAAKRVAPYVTADGQRLCSVKLIERAIDPDAGPWLGRNRAVWGDSTSDLSRLDPSGADQADADHPTLNRKVAPVPLLRAVASSGATMTGVTLDAVVAALPARLATAGQ
jgi:hypothetical protein